MFFDLLFILAAWLGATALFVGIPIWRACKREPLRRHALFLPRADGIIPPVHTEVWVEWWKPFRGVAGSGRGMVTEVRERVVVVDVDGRSIELHPTRFGKRAATGPAFVDGVKVSAVLVTHSGVR